MTRHGTLRFGFELESYEWQEIKQTWLALVDYDPYEPDWRFK